MKAVNRSLPSGKLSIHNKGRCATSATGRCKAVSDLTFLPRQSIPLLHFFETLHPLPPISNFIVKRPRHLYLSHHLPTYIGVRSHLLSYSRTNLSRSSGYTR